MVFVESATSQCIKDGDPAFYVPFSSGVYEIVAGETWCETIYPTNFGFVSATCPDLDTFCVDVTDQLGWPIVFDAAPFILDAGFYTTKQICITAPCDVTVGQTNVLTAIMAYCDADLDCRPDAGDCEDPNVYGGTNYYSTTTKSFEVVASPPALYILQDTLYLVAQGQTAAYVPFAICNGDPCAPPTDFSYQITSLGVVGGGFPQGGSVLVDGGTCEDVYAVVDAGAASVCDYDELTIIAWDTATGTVYDTCVQVIHVIEPVAVPMFNSLWVTILVLAMILAAAVILRRRAASRA